MSTAITLIPDIEAIEQVLVNGDLARLTPVQRVSYYNRVCQSLDLNPLTKPFDYINLNGKLVLYAKRDATEQLRSKRGVSVVIVARELVEDCYVVTARASFPNGRQDESIGVVNIAGAKGENRANAMMKAETKAKRRVTLSICGLGLLDETEVESIDSPKGYSVTADTVRAEDMPKHTVTDGLGNQSEMGGRSLSHEVTQHGEELPDDGQLYIVRVDITDTKNPNVKKATITLSDTRQFTTIKPALQSLCEMLRQDRVPVTLTDADIKPTRWGNDLLAIHPAESASDPDDELPPLTDADIPFAWMLPLIVPALALLNLWT